MSSVVKESTVSTEMAGKRLYRYSQLTFKEDLPSKSHCRRAILSGELRVNGDVAEDTRILHEGDIVRLEHHPGPAKLRVLTQRGLQILRQEERWLVAWKPAGVSSRGVEEAVAHLLDGGLGHSLYTLEKAASGLCLVVIPSALSRWEDQLYSGACSVTFHILCHGQLPEGQGRHIEHVTRSPGSESGYLTTAEVVMSPPATRNPGAQPSVGKRLREEMDASGHPVVGACMLAKPIKSNRDKGLFMSLTRLAFSHPDAPAIAVKITSDIPVKFLSLRERETRFFEAQQERDVQELRAAGVESLGGNGDEDVEGYNRVSHGMPVAYITGEKVFCGLRFRVTQDTLIPRVSTEWLVGASLNVLGDSPGRVLDVGTGTGCILLAILARWKGGIGLGVDISPEALQVARENAHDLGCADAASFAQGDLYRLGDILAEGDPGFRVIVCNPPYLPTKKGREIHGKGREPDLALIAGSTGLEAYRGLYESMCECPQLLVPGGRVVLEVGQGMHEGVVEIWEDASSPWEVEEMIRDKQGWVRCLVLRPCSM